MLQYAIENKDNPEKEISYLQLGFKLSIIGGLISGILLLFSKLYYPFKIDIVVKYAIFLFLVPLLLNIINYYNVIMRIKEKNKTYAHYQIITIVIHYAVIVSFIFLFGLNGSMVSQYIYNILILIAGFFLTRKMFKLNKFKNNNLSKKEKKDYIHLGISSQVNHTISNLLSTLDIFVIV